MQPEAKLAVRPSSECPLGQAPLDDVSATYVTNESNSKALAIKDDRFVRLCKLLAGPGRPSMPGSGPESTRPFTAITRSPARGPGQLVAADAGNQAVRAALRLN